LRIRVDPAAPIWRPAAVTPLVQFAQLSDAAPANRARRATIAFLESDRPDPHRAGDAFGDESIAPVRADLGPECTIAFVRM
jgi:hypothetical protein